MSVFLLLLILSEVLLPNHTCASRVRRQTTKVRISAIGDTIMLKFLQPHMDTKLEGYILGYGSNLFSKQFIQLPEDGEPYETEIDAEPKYLVAVQPVKGEDVKKQCTGKETLEKPLHLVIGSVTPNSVMLSWGTLLNTLSTETNLDDCIEDGHYTVRYREEPKKKWNYQTCPTTDTIIDQLKPDTPYEFGVRAESDNISGAWSPPVIYNTADIDVHKSQKPENILKPNRPITEIPQAFSTSVPVLHSVTQSRPASLLRLPAPPPTQRVTQAKDVDVDIHKPQKPQNLLKPKKPITESPQTFSTSVPVLHSVTQGRPASLLRLPAPPPTQRVTQDLHKPLKPEIYLRPEKPITEGPQAFSPSVSVLHSVTQSRPASLLRLPAPPPTKRVTQDIHKPRKPGNILRPKRPITKIPQAFSPSMPVLHSVTQGRPASLLRQTTPPPIPRVTLGTGSDGIRTSRPSEDSLFLTQTLTSSHTPMSNLKNTNILQTHHSSISSLSITTQQPLHTNQSQLTTSKTLFNTPKTQTNTAKTVSSTGKAQPNLTHKKRTQLHNTVHPQHESSTSSIQLRTTQFRRHTAKYPLRTPQPKPGSPQSYTIHPQTSINQSQHSTAKGQLKMTQNKFTTLEPITTQFQPHETQPQSITSQTNITHPKPIATQSPPHTTQTQSITTQSQPHTTQPQSTTEQSQPHTTQPKPCATQSPPHTTQPQSIATQSQPHTTQSQTNAVKYYPRAGQPQSSTIQSQPNTTQPQTTAAQSQTHATQFQTNTVKYYPRTDQPQSSTIQSQPHTTQPQSVAAQSQTHATKFQTSTVKYHPSTAQPQPTPTQSQPDISQPITTHSQPHPTQSQNSTVILRPGTTQTQPTITRSHPDTVQSQLHTVQPQPIKTQSNPTKHKAKSQTKTMQPKLTKTQSKPRKNQQKPRAPQSRTTQPQPTTTQSSTAKYQPNFRSHQQAVKNQHHEHIIKPKFTHETNSSYQFNTTLKGLSTTEFQQQPDHHPTSATIKHSNINTWQNGKTKLTLMSKPKQPVQTPSEKSNTQNSPWGEKKLVNKMLPVSKMAPSQSRDGHLTKPVLVSGATNRNKGQDMSSPSASVARTSAPTVTKRVSPVSVPNPIRLPPTHSNSSIKSTQASHDEKHKGQLWDKPYKRTKKKPESSKRKTPNQVDKDDDKVTDLKQVDAIPILKPSEAPPTTEINQSPTPTTTPFFAFNGSRYNLGDNSSVFSSVPISEVDPKGKKRFVAPHVIYQIDKPPEQPCSVTHSLSFFPDEENGVTNISGPPKTPPTNLTVVTVEGCPSFVILDWEKTDNETTEYEVTSSVVSPNGHVVSVVKTNQTHTAVENLKPESSYEFTVTPKNELGSGPSSESVSFSTESADPRVSEVPTGKNAIWSSFSFDADSYSECTGTQYVKRTWYRKFVGIQLCNSLRYKIYLSDSLKGKFYNIGDETGYGEDHCQFVDSFLDGRTGVLMPPHQLPLKQGYFRAMRQEPVKFGKIGGSTQINYVAWYECGVPIPGSW
ncbi:hypothetical protein PHYPO_G00203100 [Pangasianodon hypophthalmus]|uniref:Fibronectin type-III domain-containing protein n=1 Tax=Pangasianodon hypophthalmus TaxID=310915 RepID=A0A5N5PCC0_PANHP|nr:hypothetical protein PHYPO_G00203100 [Pangasianodon hypophthalmus]